MRHLTLIAAVIVSMTFAIPSAQADDHDFLEEVNSYLDISQKYLNLADRKEAAIFFAVEGIVEIYEDRGEKANAVPALQQILEQYPDNQTVRNVVRFKLRDVYRETGKADMALAELQAVITENR